MSLQSIGSVALSGMGAAMSRMTTAAHNIANAATPGFHRVLPVASTQPGGGVAVAAGQSASEGESLAEDLVAQHTALYDFRANLAVLKTGYELMGSVLDILA